MSAVASSAARLAGNVGFALRRTRRCLPAGPRKDLIVESLAVALSLLAELADTTPTFVASGGLDKLVCLACPTEPTVHLEDAPKHFNDTVHLVADSWVTVGSFSCLVLEDAPFSKSEAVVLAAGEDRAESTFVTSMKTTDLTVNVDSNQLDLIDHIPVGSASAPGGAAWCAVPTQSLSIVLVGSIQNTADLPVDFGHNAGNCAVPVGSGGAPAAASGASETPNEKDTAAHSNSGYSKKLDALSGDAAAAAEDEVGSNADSEDAVGSSASWAKEWQTRAKQRRLGQAVALIRHAVATGQLPPPPSDSNLF